MATVPVPRTWTVGELLTAAKLNTDARDAINFLLAPPLAVLTKNAGQSITSGSYGALLWQTESVDRDGGHSTVTNTNRYTAQTAGYYAMTTYAEWSLENTTGFRRIAYRVNGSTVTHQATQPPSVSNCQANLSGLLFLSVNDYVEVMADQSSGVTMTVPATARWDVAWRST